MPLKEAVSLYCFPMNPRLRGLILVGIAFVLILPYLAFVLYFSTRLPHNHWPAWFTNTMLIWFLANFLILWLIAKRMSKHTAEPQFVLPPPSTKSQIGIWVARIVGSYLVILWSGFFLYGLKETIQRKFALSRALPAGAFLLFFIAIFGWATYRSWRRKTSK
jgi:VanZ family protein